MTMASAVRAAAGRGATPAKPAARPAIAPRPAVRPRIAGLRTAPPAIRLEAAKPPSARTQTPPRAGGAQAVPADVRKAIEEILQVDLEGVRVHTDTNANQLATSLGARAVTFGADIFLGPGERPTDLQLLAHEVAHVVQQQGVERPQRW